MTLRNISTMAAAAVLGSTVMLAPSQALAAPATAVVPQTISIEAPAQPTRVTVAPAAVTAKIHHYNICNAARNKCTLAQAKFAQDVLVFLAVLDGAWFISVNEICQDDFAELIQRLNASGTMVFSKQREDGCGGKAYGNALFYPGGVRQDGKVWYLSNEGKNCADPETECRTMLCMKFATFAGNMGQCTAHLGGKDEAETIKQAAEYIWNTASWMEVGRRVSMAGDFNLTRNQLPGAYDGMRNLVIGNTFPTRPAPTRRIDFIFVQPVGNWTPFDAYCAEKNASDHCWTKGEWNL